jgi:tetratricopeptide (TPR) repeat protein
VDLKMLLKSLLNNKYNRFYFGFPKMKPVALLFLYFFLTLTAFTESDFDLGDNDIVYLPEINKTVSDKSKKKADSLTNYALGFLELKNNNFIFTEKVQERFLKSLKSNPKAITPLTFLTKNWISKQKHELLIEKLLPIAKSNPDAVMLNVTVANSLYKRTKIQEAIELLKKSLKTVGLERKSNKGIKESSELIINLSSLYGETKEWSEGEALLDRIFENTDMKKSLEVRTAAAKFYSLCSDQPSDGFFASWDKKRYKAKLEKNLKVIEDLSEKNKLETMSIFPILAIFEKYSMGERAEKFILSQLCIQPENPEIFIILAKILDNNKKFSDAYRAWNIIVNTSRYPRIKKKWESISVFLNLNPNLRYQLGYAALKSERWKEAVIAFDWGLIQNPNDPMALFQLGYAYLKMEKYKKAIYKFEKVKGIPESVYYISHCYRKLGEYDKAFNAMQEAEDVAKKSNNNRDFLNKDFYIEYAYIADKAEKAEVTEKILQKLLKEDPENANLNNFLGFLWAEQNRNLEQAEKLIRKALDKEPENFAYLDSMAWVLYRMKDYKNALYYIKESLEKSDVEYPDAVISDHAGDIYFALGKKEQALKYWKLSLETFSTDVDHETIRKKIESLKQ